MQRKLYAKYWHNYVKPRFHEYRKSSSDCNKVSVLTFNYSSIPSTFYFNFEEGNRNSQNSKISRETKPHRSIYIFHARVDIYWRLCCMKDQREVEFLRNLFENVDYDSTRFCHHAIVTCCNVLPWRVLQKGLKLALSVYRVEKRDSTNREIISNLKMSSSHMSKIQR